MQSNIEDIYIAKVRVKIDKYKESNVLNVFLVEAIKKRNIFNFGKKQIVGFKEIITNEIIIDRKYYILDEFDTVSYDINHGSRYTNIGDLVWEVINKAPAYKLLSKKEIEKYLEQTPDEIINQIETLKDNAINYVNKETLNSNCIIRRKKQ